MEVLLSYKGCFTAWPEISNRLWTEATLNSISSKKKELRKPTEIKCFYTRQDKLGSELIITNDQPTFSCLKEMKCKRE